MSVNPGRGLRPKQAAQHLGISQSLFWVWTKKYADFPKSIKLTPRVTIFFEGELDAWLARQAERARNAA
jgi:prophage regulatory protein